MAIPGEVLDLELVRDTEVKIEGPNGPIAGYLASPADPGRYPGLIVVHEAFGMVEHLRDIARRFAALGFHALAPALDSRVGAPDPNDVPSVMSAIYDRVDARVVGDLEAVAAHLRTLDAATGRVGWLGFCSGGRQTLLLACCSFQVDAAVDCWGGFVTRATPDHLTTLSRPVPVIDLLAGLRCPLLVVVGAEDQNPSPEIAGQLQERLGRSGKTAAVSVFQNAGHAFLANYRPTYREAAAFELWPQIVSFLTQHLT